MEHKTAERPEELFSKFINYYCGFDGNYHPQVMYYKGDLSEVDVSTDYRFHTVPKRRRQAMFLGLEMKWFPEIELKANNEDPETRFL